MKRKHKIEFTIVSIIILALSAVLVYQFRFNRKFLYEQAHFLCEQGRYDEAIPRCVKFLNRWEKGEYVEEARQELFCKALPSAKTLLDASDVIVAVEAFRNSESQWVRDMAELALIHIGMKASIKPGGKYDAFLKWWDETVGDIGRPPGMTLAPAGEFMMGSPENEKGRCIDEGPVHSVRITKPFYIGKFEITQQQYEVIMGKNPSFVKGLGNPVECVTWNDAVEFCRKLSERGSHEHRLPTEAEWEYACRAGSQTRYYYGADPDYKQLRDHAWYRDNSNGKAHPVGRKKPNMWGLYDMHGNVWEWCADWYDGDYYKESQEEDPKGPSSGSLRVLRNRLWRSTSGPLRVLRGGSWGNTSNYVRGASRCNLNPMGVRYNIGFRVVALPSDFR